MVNDGGAIELGPLASYYASRAAGIKAAIVTAPLPRQLQQGALNAMPGVVKCQPENCSAAHSEDE